MATQIDVRQRAVGPWPMNSYVLVCPATHASVLIDPGADPAALRDMLAGTTPVAILVTHTHGDHVGELERMRRELGVPVMAYDGPRTRGVQIAVDRALHHGDEVLLGQQRLVVRATPGHSNDMLSFLAQSSDIAIVGDTIFAGGPGRTWSADDFRTTLHTLRDEVLGWPNATLCYPGHGSSFRLGDLRPQIEAFLAHPHDDFFGDAEWGM
jgi:hydroxyacylglutathione hydrolase